MQRRFVMPLSSILFALIFPPALVHAQGAGVPSEQFQPFTLVGDWQFTNSAGVKYGGAVELKVASIERTSLLRGTASYDGRQTNDKCGTRGIASDEPVPAEFVKSENQYRVSFKLKCLRGESPRQFDWTLVCNGATCSQPTLAPNGTGAITLTEKR